MYKCTELCLLVFLNNQQIRALTWVIRLFLGETLSSFTPTPPKCISRYQQIYCCGWEVNLQRCLTFADCRPQTTECRPQIAGCKLKDTKNLPNKGDTIKNITSCESEKVAKLASFPRCCWLFFTDATLYWLIQHITNCVVSLFFFDYCELVMTSSNAH